MLINQLSQKRRSAECPRGEPPQVARANGNGRLREMGSADADQKVNEREQDDCQVRPAAAGMLRRT